MLLEWLKRLFKHRKPEAISWTKPYAKSSTIESKVSTYPVKPTLTEGKPIHVRIEPTPTTPITHPTRYHKFFKKKRQPTTVKMNIKCLLGFHDWSYNRKRFTFKCKSCGKIKVIPSLALASFICDMLEINMKSEAILALLKAGRSEEAKAKLEEWKREEESEI